MQTFYGDPHIHMAIPAWKITHMGIQNLISHMEIFPVCTRLVTEISPYAYADYVSCDPHMLLIPTCICELQEVIGSHHDESLCLFLEEVNIIF